MTIERSSIIQLCPKITCYCYRHEPMVWVMAMVTINFICYTLYKNCMSFDIFMVIVIVSTITFWHWEIKVTNHNNTNFVWHIYCCYYSLVIWEVKIIIMVTVNLIEFIVLDKHDKNNLVMYICDCNLFRLISR